MNFASTQISDGELTTRLTKYPRLRSPPSIREVVRIFDLSGVQGMVKLSGLWEADDMKRPELTNVGWLGPRDEMDRASHRFGKCSECYETICVEKAVTDGPSTREKTNETLYEAFRTHVKLKHSEEFNLAAIPATERHEA
jgi:hypothetical protein